MNCQNLSDVLEVMRQPIEDREVTISRAKFTVTYPSSLCWLLNMNLSPSGFFNDPDAPQTLSPHEMQRYLSKISGPLLDRIIHIEVTSSSFDKLSDDRKAENSRHSKKSHCSPRITISRFEQMETSL
jgi:magnesium chelatase family protein